MHVGITKPGQGYWVRVLSAVFAGVLTLAAAQWAWEQAAVLDLPVRAYELSLEGVEGELAADDTVTLLAPPTDLESTRDSEEIGVAVVESFEARDRRRAVVTILPPAGLPEGRNALDANRLADADGGAFEARVRSRRADPVVARIFVSAGLAGVIILAGAIAIFLLVGSGRRSVDFLIVTDGEMKKVNWPTRPEVVGSTQVVIFASVLLAAILFMVDVGFSKFFQFVGVLEGG